MQKLKLFCLTLFLLLAALWSVQAEVVNMPLGDGASRIVTLGENPVRFYDAGGETGDIPRNQVSIITFVPQEGEIVEILFESLDLGASSLIRIFDGQKSLIHDYDDWYDEDYYMIPGGHKLSLSGSKENELVQSESADGKLTVAYSGPMNASGSGWVATVRSVKPAPVTPEPATGDILMPRTQKIYIVSDPVNFYDDGGKEGKIALNFEGSVTFIPATPGNKVQIDFTKLDIFNTSTIGRNDILKIYNGREAVEANLITTLLKEKKLVKSAADDGSITVTLKSTTGVTANGWEAVVSEYLPQPMSFAALDLSLSASGEKLAGSTLDEQFLMFNIRTVNGLNPLVLQSARIDASGTDKPASIEKARIYFLGEKNEFSTGSVFGEGDVVGSNIQLTGDLELQEGDNWFVLVYDISSAASNGDIVAAKLTELLISDETIIPETPLTAVREVENIFYHRKGTHQLNIHDTWIFTDTKSQYNPSYYHYEDAECIITFVPDQAGSVAEIDFSSFDVAYSSSSYTGVRAVFEIYSGNEVKNSQLLWKLESADQSKIGPLGKLRSTAENGAITIRFNAKTSISAYAGKGWSATVRPFVSYPMEIRDVTVSQQNFDNILPGSVKQEVINFEIETEGDLSPLMLRTIQVDLKNSLPAVSAVKVWSKADEEDFSDAQLFGFVENPGTEIVNITGEQELREGGNSFRLTYDIQSQVVSDLEVDARLLSVTTEGAEAFAPAEGDPEGVRLIKNELHLENGANGEVVVSNPFLFYDDGGAAANYSPGQDATITFLPSGAGEVVKMSFNDFHTSTTHYFYLYHGAEVDESRLIGRYSGTSLPPAVYSQSEDGALTVRFTSGSGTIYNRGWEINVESYTIQDLYVGKLTTELAGSESVLRGAQQAAMMKIAVHVEGDEGLIKLNDFKFTHEGTDEVADIQAAQLFYTAASAGFIPDNELGAGTSNSTYLFHLENDLSVDKPGVYYFWFTFDLAPEATTGNAVEARLVEVLVNGEVFEGETEVLSPAKKVLKAGFKGDYIIGSSDNADFASFADAVAALSGGVEGAVNFKVEAGTYSENILIRGVQGTSAENRIRFTSLSGENSDVIIRGSGYKAPPYGEQALGMIAVDSTQYVVFENMSILPQFQTYPYAVHVLNTSRYFTLRNCIVTAQSTGSATSGMSLVKMEARNVDGHNNDYITIENNTLTGGYIALYLGGTGYVALTRERGAIVRNNLITDAGFKGVYLVDEDNGLVENNTILSSASARNGYIGIDIYRNKGELIVRNNKIVNNQSFYSAGINLRNGTAGSEEKPVLVYNNSVAISASPSISSAALDIPGDASNIHFYHNTLSVAGVSGRAMYVSGTNEAAQNMIFSNNLVQFDVSSAGAQIYFINREKQRDAYSFSNNAYHYTGTSFANNATWGGSSFADWVENSGETGSFEEKAEFVSSADLHLKEAGNLNSAAPVSFITSDADGNQRSALNPTIGAYEFAVIEVVKPEINSGYPKLLGLSHNSVKMATQWSETGKLYALIQKSDAEMPAPEDLLELTPVNANKDQEVATDFRGLEEESSYRAWFIFVSALDVVSDLVMSDIVTTEKQIFPLKVTLTDSQTISRGETATLIPEVSGGVEPYVYTWTNSMMEPVSDEKEAVLQPASSGQYRLTVRSADNQEAIAYSDVIVHGEEEVARFEDNYLAPESYWQGRAELASDEMESKFYSGSYSFTNTYIPDWYTWGGFAYSNETSTVFSSMDHQFRSVAGKGAENSETYAVVYPFGAQTEIGVTHTADDTRVKGVYLTNAAYTYDSMINGDFFAGDPFGAGDYFRVKFTGKNSSGETSVVLHYLADLTSDNEADHYILNDWKWFDLSVLGAVRSITISVEGSRNGDYGLNTPAYFCMDNLGSPKPTTTSVDSNPVTVDVYPNPFVDYIVVQAEEACDVTLYDLRGSVVLKKQLTAGSNRLDTSGLSSGVYLLKAGDKLTKIVK